MGRKAIDLTGNRFGRLRVVKKEEKKNRRIMWLCQCDCGKQIITSSSSLRSGNSRSCGCLQKEIAINSNFSDITGQRFGKLTAIKLIRKERHKETLWLCKCDCGNFAEAPIGKLKSSRKKSCGCLKSGGAKYFLDNKKNVSAYDKRIYRIWIGMKTRCYNPNSVNYKYYGEIGIGVCDEWKDNFQAFYDWSMKNGYQENLTIDRIDGTKGYSPDNCRWVTMKEQQRNTRQTKMVEYNGEIKTISEWSEITGISKNVLRQRLKNGWSVEKCIETPMRRTLKKEYYG